MTRIGLALALMAAAARPVAQSPSAGEPQDVRRTIDRAHTAAFNLDHDEALALARQAVALAPDVPAAHRALATVLWTSILFRTGAVTVDHFMGSLTKSRDSRPPVPPDLLAELTSAVERAIALADDRVARDPERVDARYELGAAYAIQASFRASVEGSVRSAFGAARQAYSNQERVLAREPEHPGANVIAGTYRYVVSGLGLPTRWLAYMVGFGGDRERGIAMIEAASRHTRSEVDALAALLLIYTREDRHADALAVAERLARAYPRNRLFALEVGSAALRAGRPTQAELALSAGLVALEHDRRPLAPGERALWHYKRASARIALGRLHDAGRDLEAALAAGPLVWIRGRIHLERGKIHDLEGRRDQARAAYDVARQIAAANDDPIGQAAADRYRNRAFVRDETSGGPGPVD
ncbi:MAG TPA: tetratricopeptide repeat protein [Vicinamibacterales bacterium]|nr:tetratricopeptide repeat protein [Vicinamibacterales bacterium]